MELHKHNDQQEQPRFKEEYVDVMAIGVVWSTGEGCYVAFLGRNKRQHNAEGNSPAEAMKNLCSYLSVMEDENMEELLESPVYV